jgi:Ca2+-binding EF-hand superfamily protein
MSFAVPKGFPEVLKNFTQEILRAINMDNACGSDEDQILDWARRYFAQLAQKNLPTLSQEEVFSLAQKLFVAADADCSGSLDKAEVRSVLEDLAGDLSIRKSKQINNLVDEVMQKADVNENGTVDYEEFLPVAVDIVQTVALRVAAQAAQDLRELREVVEKIFDVYDEDRSGFLDASEFNAVFTDLTSELGLSISDSTRLSEEILQNVDVNGDGQVQRAEFMPIAMDILQSILDEAEADREFAQDEDQLIKQAQDVLVHGMTEEELTEILFGLFKDADKDASGFLDADEFHNCLTSTEIGFTQEEIELMKNSVDANGDGRIDFNEFVPLAYSLLVEVIAKQIGDENEKKHSLSIDAQEKAQQLVNDLSDAELEDTLRKIFDGADKNNNGVLELDEFRECLRSSNLGFTDDLIQYLVSEVDSNKDNVIDYAEFCPLCYELLLKIIEVEVSKDDGASDKAAESDNEAGNAEDVILSGMSSEEIESLLYDIFQAADVDGSGNLDPNEFSQALRDSDINLSPEQIKSLLAEIDTDGDGQINYVEFVPVAFEVLTKIVADTMKEEDKRETVEGMMAEEEESIRMDVFREEAEEKLIHGMTQAELTAHFQAIFQAADEDNSGELEYDEFVRCLKGSELDFLQEEIEFLGLQADQDQSGTISFTEFAPLAYDLLVEHMAQAIRGQHEQGMAIRDEASAILSGMKKEDLEKTVLGLFQESDGDNSGLIDKAEFIHAMNEAKIGLNDDDIETLYARVDINNDGKINYSEFAPLCYDILVEVLARQLASAKIEDAKVEDL